MIVSYLSLALLLSFKGGGAIGWRAPRNSYHYPLQGSNFELRFAANFNLPLCVIGHFKLFSYRCSNICIFCHQAKS